MKNKLYDPKKGAILATTTAIILTILKLSIGLYSGIYMIVASAIDSSMDTILSIFNLFAIKETEKPFDTSYNYGRGKMEGIAALIEGILIGTSGIYIIYGSIQKWINQEESGYVGLSIIVMGISILLTGFLVWYLTKISQLNDSLIVKSDLLHYKMDLYTNTGILTSLIIIYFTNYYFVDSLISIILGIYILINVFPLIKSGLNILMDKSLESEIVQNIKDIILKHDIENIHGFHQLKTRSNGNIFFIDFHLVFNSSISLIHAHEISEQLEIKIKDRCNKKCVINIHLDAYDDEKKDTFL